MTTLSRAITRTLLTLALCSTGLVAATPAAIAGGGCAPSHVVGDLDDDGLSDPVALLPDDQSVQLMLSGGAAQTVTRSSLGLGTSGDEDAFGESAVVADFNADGCADLAVGSPGVPHGTSGGSVYVAFGTGTGTFYSAYAIPAPLHAFMFGHALTWLDTARQLVAGAPYADDGSVDQAGAIVVLPLDGSGHVASTLVLNQSSPNIPGVSETEDHFGAVLAGSGRTVVVGTPEEDIGSKVDAGGVAFLSTTDAAPTTFRGRGIDQNSAGVPGSAETDDQFGETLAMRGEWVVVGVPHEDLSGMGNAGAVQPFTWKESTRTLTVKPMISQNSRRVPGSNEGGDLFGSALAIGKGLVGTGETSVAIGAYGEDVGHVFNGGTVTVVELTRGESTRRTVQLSSSEVGGTVVASDQFGMGLATLRGDDSLGASVHDGLAIGVPGFDAPGASDAGAIYLTRRLGSTWIRRLNGDLVTPPAEVSLGYSLAAAIG